MITLIIIIIDISSHPLIRLLLCPKISDSEIYYCGKILGKTDFTASINLVSVTGGPKCAIFCGKSFY